MSYLNFSNNPGFDIYADRGPHLIRVCSVMIALSAIAVALRLTARRLSKVQLRWDDWLILIALPLAWIPSILMIYSVRHFNFGKHLQWATTSDIRHFWICLYASEIIYPMSLVLIKCSILFLFYRVFHVPQLKIYASTIGVTVILWGITTLAIAIFSCNPIDAYWDTQITDKACFDTFGYFLGIGIPNIILDVLILILPLPFLWRSHITLLSQKAGLLFVFAVGGFVVIAATLRLNTAAIHKNSVDFTYDLIDLAVWTAVETNAGIICACFAAMQSLLEAAVFGILDTMRSTPSIINHTPYSGPEPRCKDKPRSGSLHLWPRHNTAPAALGNGRPTPTIRKIMRRRTHTASSSWGFNQPLPPDFLIEPPPIPLTAIRELRLQGFQTERSLPDLVETRPGPPDTTKEPTPIIRNTVNAQQPHEYDVERAEIEIERPKRNKVAGISRFNAFDDVDVMAREERISRMRRKMERSGWPVTGERRAWI